MQIFIRLAHSRSGKLTAGATLALGAALALISHPAAAQVPDVGVWINHEGKGAVEIKPCGPALCGNIVWLRDPINDEGKPLSDRRNPEESKRTRPICGLPVIGSVKRTSEGWDEGWIYNPEEGAQYDVYLKASGDRLTVTGYKGVKLFSKTFTWTRAPADLQRCDGAKQTKAKPAAPLKPAAPVNAATTPAPGAAPAKPKPNTAVTPAPNPAQDKAATAPKAAPAAKPATKATAKSPSAAPSKAATTAKAPSPKPAARPPQAATTKPGTATSTAATEKKKAPAKKAAAPGTAAAAPKGEAAKPAVAKKKTADETEASSAVE